MKAEQMRLGVFKHNNEGIRQCVEITYPTYTTELHLTDNKITDFVGLEDNENMHTLNVSRNPILTFRGFPKLPRLTNLIMLETPLSLLPNFRQLAIIAAGKDIKTINGIDVTASEVSSANQYGDPEASRELITRGWLPKKPAYNSDIKIKLNQPTKKKQKKNDSTKNSGQELKKFGGKRGNQSMLRKYQRQMKNLEGGNLKRVMEVLIVQELDPISVKSVRLLRAVGYDRESIRKFLRELFSPSKKLVEKVKRVKKEEINPNSLEGQLKKQEEVIQALAAQLHALRNENRTYNTYDQMLKEVGAPLFENAEVLLGEKGIIEEELEKQAGFYPEIDDMEGLRQAVIEYFKCPNDSTDEELIMKIKRIMCAPEEEEDVFDQFAEAGEEEEDVYDKKRVIFKDDDEPHKQEDAHSSTNDVVPEHDDVLDIEGQLDDDDIVVSKNNSPFSLRSNKSDKYSKEEVTGNAVDEEYDEEEEDDEDIEIGIQLRPPPKSPQS